MTSTNLRAARAMYEAYMAKDRAAAEALIAADFQFTSPLDNCLNRESYFAICWPNSAHSDGFEVVHMVEDGDQVFVTYESVGRQTRFRNTEILTVDGGQIVAVEVYFGWNVPHEVPVGAHRGPK
jgi:ketosteroid isomerase-like protein